MKNKLAVTIKILILMLFACLQSQAAIVSFTLTNSVGQPDTNTFLVIPVSTPINASGGYVQTGIPVRMVPNSSGYSQTNLLVGNYIATNAYIKTVLFRAPDDFGQTIYPFNTLLISGANTFVTIIYGTNPPPTLNALTNSLGYMPLQANQNITIKGDATGSGNTNIPLVITNLPMVQVAGLPATLTNLYNITNALGSSAWSNAGAFYPMNLNPSNYVQYTTWTNGSNNFSITIAALSVGMSNNNFSSLNIATNDLLAKMVNLSNALRGAIIGNSNTSQAFTLSVTQGYTGITLRGTNTFVDPGYLSFVSNVLFSTSGTGGGGASTNYVIAVSNALVSLIASTSNTVAAAGNASSVTLSNAIVAATNGQTTIVYTNPAAFLPRNNGSNYQSGLQVTNIIVALLTTNIQFGTIHATNVFGYDRTVTVDGSGGSTGNPVTIYAGTTDFEDSQHGKASDLQLFEGRGSGDPNGIGTLNTNGNVRLGFTNDSVIIIPSTNIIAPGITNMIKTVVSQFHPNTNTYRAGSGVAITTNAPNDVVISFNGSASSTNSIFTSVTISNVSANPFYLITHACITGSQTNAADGCYTWNPTNGYMTNGNGFVLIPLDPTNGTVTGVPVQTQPSNTVKITIAGSSQLPSVNGTYSLLRTTNLSGLSGPNFIFTEDGGSAVILTKYNISATNSFPTFFLFTNFNNVVFQYTWGMEGQGAFPISGSSAFGRIIFGNGITDFSTTSITCIGSTNGLSFIWGFIPNPLPFGTSVTNFDWGVFDTNRNFVAWNTNGGLGWLTNGFTPSGDWCMTIPVDYSDPTTLTITHVPGCPPYCEEHFAANRPHSGINAACSYFCFPTPTCVTGYGPSTVR